MNKRIRILFTISNFNTAGSGKVVYDLAHSLDKNKFDIEIACEDEEGGFFNEIKALNLPIHLFETKTNYKPYYSLLFRILKISKFYKKHNYDIVHSWQWSSDWTEALAARLVGKKWLYTKKAMGFGSSHWKIKSRLASFIITVNLQMKEYFPNKKAQQLIPFGLDTDYYSLKCFDDTFKEEDECFHVITIANLVPVKKIEVLIHALKLLEGKSVKLTIIGDNTTHYGQEMLALTKTLGLEQQIDFLGKQSDVRFFYSKADLYVITSEKEGMPMALVEAMSMGVPVLGANSPGINYVLKDFEDFLFSFGDSKALADKIQYMKSLNTLDRTKIGNSLRQYCINHFDINRFIKAHEDLYIRLAEEN